MQKMSWMALNRQLRELSKWNTPLIYEFYSPSVGAVTQIICKKLGQCRYCLINWKSRIFINLALVWFHVDQINEIWL